MLNIHFTKNGYCFTDEKSIQFIVLLCNVGRKLMLVSRLKLRAPARRIVTAGGSPQLKTANEQSSSRTSKNGVNERKCFPNYRPPHFRSLLSHSIRKLPSLYFTQLLVRGLVAASPPHSLTYRFLFSHHNKYLSSSEKAD